MATDVLIHWLLDMSGAVTFACIMRGCQNPEHQHNPVTRWMAQHPWLAQSLAAVVVAYFTVRLIG